MSETTLRYLEVFLPAIIPTAAAFAAVYVTYWLTRKSERQSRVNETKRKNDAIRAQLRNEMRSNQSRIETWIHATDQTPDDERSALEIFLNESLDVLTSIPLTPFSFDMWTARLIDLPDALSEEELHAGWRFYDGLRELNGLVEELRSAADQDEIIRRAQALSDPSGLAPNHLPPQGFSRAERAILGRFKELGPFLLDRAELPPSLGDEDNR